MCAESYGFNLSFLADAESSARKPCKIGIKCGDVRKLVTAIVFLTLISGRVFLCVLIAGKAFFVSVRKISVFLTETATHENVRRKRQRNKNHSAEDPSSNSKP